jgi:UDP-N-acetylglucosamine acyltransferase
MTRIHPTAIVAPGAELGDGVEIGPYCIVAAGVRLGDGCWRPSMVHLQGQTRIGPRCRFYHGAVVGSPPQDLKFTGASSFVEAGEGNTFREFCTVNRATGEGEVTRIGDHNLIMAYAHVAHNCRVGSHAILANSANLAGHVTLEDYAIIGGVTPVHQFVRVGAHSIVGGGCRVPKDVPPYVKAAGNPLRIFGLNSVGLSRRGFSPEALAELRKLYRIFFRLGMIKERAVEEIRRSCAPLPEIEAFCRFVEQSERGLTR